MLILPNVIVELINVKGKKKLSNVTKVPSQVTLVLSNVMMKLLHVIFW